MSGNTVDAVFNVSPSLVRPIIIVPVGWSSININEVDTCPLLLINSPSLAVTNSNKLLS